MCKVSAMMRFQAWAAAVCVAAYALLAPVELVLCIGPDGGVMLEAAACQCCGGCEPAGEGGAPPRRPEPRMAPGKGACNLCVDVPLRVQGGVQSLASGRVQLRGAAAVAPAVVVVVFAVPPCALPLRAAFTSPSPPLDSSLVALQSVVLLI